MSAEAVEYAVRCPKCRARAAAFMISVGAKGTYREATSRMGARRDRGEIVARLVRMRDGG